MTRAKLRGEVRWMHGLLQSWATVRDVHARTIAGSLASYSVVSDPEMLRMYRVLDRLARVEALTGVPR